MTSRDEITVQPKGGSGRTDRTTDFVKKRGEDLNIMLVVAGLFSAVTSAFIIYIHPQLQTDPNKESADLLRVLLYKTDNTTFGGDVPEVPKWTGPPHTVVAALVLLYLSLAASMTSVFFAILAKQLMVLYALAGPSRSSAENGQSQRRNLKWFTMILLLSLLLQLALLLLSCALIVYVWKINLAVASFLLALTFFVIPVYLLLVSLALANLDFSRFWPFWKA